MKKKRNFVRKLSNFFLGKFSKKGISAVIAIVLIIMMSITGVVAIWKLVLPMFSGVENFAYEDLKLGITLEGYTVYDPENGYIFVQVKRGNDNLNLVGLEITFSVEGNSVTYEINETEVPEVNGKRTYAFNLRNDGIMGEPTKVSIAPVISKGEKEYIGKVLSEVILPKGTINPEDLERIRAEAARRHPKGIETVIDPVLHPYYLDSDGDTYGNPLVSDNFREEEQPENYIERGDDCDDNNPNRHPGLAEVANNILDENCDGWAGINSCFYINLAGNYQLMNDVNANGDCFVIPVPDVVLDGNDKIVTGSGSSGVGIRTQGALTSNVTIQNFKKIKSFLNGITISGSSKVYLKNLVVEENLQDAIRLLYSNEVNIQNVVSCNNEYRPGLVCVGSTGSISGLSKFKGLGDDCGNFDGYDLSAQSCPTPVYKCGTINAPGNYLLMNDVNPLEGREDIFTGNVVADPPAAEDCFIMNADNIIFDGNNKKIIGIESNKYGIKIEDSQNVVIQNTNIRCLGTNSGTGVYVHSSSYSSTYPSEASLDNLNIQNCQNGIYLHYTAGNLISNSNLTQNKYGINFYESEGNSLSKNWICGNTGFPGYDISCVHSTSWWAPAESKSVIGTHWGCDSEFDEYADPCP